MAVRQITDFTGVTTPALADEFLIQQSGTTYKETLQQIHNSNTSLTAKTTLADADTFSLNDSAASNAAKKITVANLRNSLTYGTLVETVVSAADWSQVSAGDGTWYNPTSCSISLTAGKWLISYSIPLYYAATCDGLVATLSTANNSESNKKYTSVSPTNYSVSLTRSFVLSVASTTTYYLNVKRIGGTTATLYSQVNTISNTIITALQIGA